MKILFKLTTRKRPEKAQRTIDSIHENATGTDYFISVSVDEDDETWHDLHRYDFLGMGKPSNKIQAINRDVDIIPFTWDILVNVSDDQVFIKKGFDEIIRRGFIDTKFNVAHLTTQTPFEEQRINLDKFLHFPDGNREDLCTMSIIGRYYYERDKYIYNPIYANEYCDNEAQEVAKIRGCYKFVNEHIFNHLHGNYGKGEYDALHKLNEQKGYINHDAMKYAERKINNFGL